MRVLVEVLQLFAVVFCGARITNSHAHEAVHLANMLHLQLGCIPQLIVRFAILQLLPAGCN